MTRKRIDRPLHALAAAAITLLMPGAQAASHVWNSGTFVAGLTAPSPLPLGDVLDIGTGGLKYFDGTVSDFTNAGTVNWNADALYLQSGVNLVNHGLWNATADNSLLYNGGAAPSFTNHGTFRKSGGVGATTVGGTTGFVNHGTLDAQTGILDFAGGTVFAAGTVFTGAGVNQATNNNTFAGAFTSGNLRLAAGVHTGSTAVLGGSVAYTAGTLSGTWTVAAGQTLHGETGGFKYLDGAATVLTNQGTIAWNTADAWYLQSGAGVVNQGLFLAQASTTLLYNGGAAPSFNNTASGTLRAAAGQTLTIGSTTGLVNNGGVLDAQAGGAIVYSGGSVFNAGTQFTGAGVNQATNNNTFAGAFTSGNLRLAAGVHTGSTAVLGGSVAYTAGTLSGTWTVAAGQTLNGETGGFKYLDGAATVLTNQGTIAWNTADAWYLQSGAGVVNQGLFLAQASTTLLYNGGAAPSFNNTASGTLRAAAGQTLTIGNTTGLVNNGGALDAQAGGAIVYSGGSVFNAGTQFTGAGVNRAAGDNTFNGSQQSANLVLAGGTHGGNAALVNGSVVFSGGTLAGTWTVGAGQTLQGSSGGFKYLTGAGTTLVNQGSIDWSTDDTLYVASGAALTNAGTLDFGADGDVLYNGGAVPSFVNIGLITKSGGAGTSTIGDNLAFDNQGSIDVQAGTVALPTNFNNAGTLQGSGSYGVAGTLVNAGTVAPGALPGASTGTLGLLGSFAQAPGGTFAVDLESLASHDLFNVSGTAALGGTLALSCLADCSFAVGDVVTILDSAGDLSGSFASVTLSGFATGAFDLVYDTAADRVQLVVSEAVTPVPEPGSYAMLLAGLAAVGYLAQRRRRAGDQALR